MSMHLDPVTNQPPEEFISRPVLRGPENGPKVPQGNAPSSRNDGKPCTRNEATPRIGAHIYRMEFSRLAPRFRLLNAALFFCPHFALNLTRTRLYRLAGIHIGHGSVIYGTIELSGEGRFWERLTIGDHCQITAPLYVDLNAEIKIGDRVAIGHHAKLITSNHDHQASARRCGAAIFQSIVIGDGAWIGAGAMVLAGVSVGAGAVVAAGAVVTRDVPPNTLVAGVPARPIRQLPD